MLSKVFWYRQGNEIAQPQLSDIAGIVPMFGDTLDREHLRHRAVQVGVGDLLDRVLQGNGSP